MKDYIEITVTVSDNVTKELLTAMLAQQGFEGFEETDDEIKAYTEDANFIQDELEKLLNKFQLTYKSQLIPAQNWNVVWEANFQPVNIDDFLFIRADFHEPKHEIAHEIIITPKMSFGTGHHATTYMMAQQMREINFTGKDVFDFGTGTGILAILAEKLGAVSITAIDNDEWSIRNAQENIVQNSCKKVNLYQSSSLDKNGKFDIILANINKNIILEYFHSLADSLKKNGKLLLSGLLAMDEGDILFAANSFQLKHISTISKDKWICMQFLI